MYLPVLDTCIQFVRFGYNGFGARFFHVSSLPVLDRCIQFARFGYMSVLVGYMYPVCRFFVRCLRFANIPHDGLETIVHAR